MNLENSREFLHDIELLNCKKFVEILNSRQLFRKIAFSQNFSLRYHRYLSNVRTKREKLVSARSELQIFTSLGARSSL